MDNLGARLKNSTISIRILRMKFSRTDKNGNVEHWGAEVANNPSRLARVGWTKSRSLAALQPGTRVKLYRRHRKAGGHLAIVGLIENEKGELICSEREDAHNGRRYGRRSRRLAAQARRPTKKDIDRHDKQ